MSSRRRYDDAGNEVGQLALVVPRDSVLNAKNDYSIFEIVSRGSFLQRFIRALLILMSVALLVVGIVRVDPYLIVFGSGIPFAFGLLLLGRTVDPAVVPPPLRRKPPPPPARRPDLSAVANEDRLLEYARELYATDVIELPELEERVERALEGDYEGATAGVWHGPRLAERRDRQAEVEARVLHDIEEHEHRVAEGTPFPRPEMDTQRYCEIPDNVAWSPELGTFVAVGAGGGGILVGGCGTMLATLPADPSNKSTR